ncbi:AAA family ATPase [Pseudomonas aeruginosa]|uniref:AAA family ATPase n=1 Tax=Pseudomonas aeruginosa TaxID=287 RepID=UPI0032FE6BDB|nr:hypothetical protein [Pseudomonas aeruginosa]HDQ4550075.1 hypothetical protein [Pseudomonas aeruginosa]
MTRLRFKKLWLVSETTRAARKIEFHPNRTLLVGKNHTGKSTVIKHIFRTLGCQTKGKSDRWDSLAISVLEFELNGKSYTAYRKASVYALRDDEGASVRVTTSYSEWTDIIASIFEFRLMLPTHQETLAQATPPYLFLPYYMDQDGSWLQQWNSFDKLSQFSNWKKPLAAYVTGQRPNGFYLAKFEESKAKASLSQLNQELGVIQSALSRVRKTLPRPAIRLDATAFKQEITDLLRTSTLLKSEQESLRKKAFECAAQRESLSSQVSMARHALRDLEGDLKYLTESKTELAITCPTCGTNHESGFPVRLELIDDAVTLRKVLSELEVEHLKCEEQLANIYGKINRVKRKVMGVEKTLQAKKGMLRLQDVVDSQSSEVIRGAFTKDIDSLKRQIFAQEKVSSEAKFKVSQFDLPERTKAINDFYSERMELFATELGVHDVREDVKKRPDASISASGSALPRSLLAYQFAVLHTAKEKGDAKHLPIIIDSPNQQGQDADHLRQMLSFIVKRTPTDQQLVLAVEEMPDQFNFDGGLVELKTPFGLLDAGQYDLACDELRGMAIAVEAGLDQRLASSRVGSFEEGNEPS